MFSSFSWLLTVETSRTYEPPSNRIPQPVNAAIDPNKSALQASFTASGRTGVPLNFM